MYRPAALISMLVAALAMSTGAACYRTSADDLQTFPVTGTVLSGEGSPLPGGAVYFRPSEQDEWEAIAEIQSDGSFTLYTMFQGQRLAGAVAGAHTVTVVPPSDASGISPAITVSETILVAPSENQLTIELPR